MVVCMYISGFFFTDAATTDTYTDVHSLCRHDAFPIGRREAAAFRDSLSTTRAAARRSAGLTAETVGEALDHWIDVCAKVGRHGREPVERKTLTSYQRDRKSTRLNSSP